MAGKRTNKKMADDSMDAIIEAVSEQYKNSTVHESIEYKGINLEFDIKTRLSLTDIKNIVDAIVTLVFKEDSDGVEHYCPYLYDFAYQYSVILHSTNIKLPEYAEQIWEFLSETDVCNKVFSTINDEDINIIVTSSRETIFDKRQCLNQSISSSAISTKISGFISKIQDKIESLNNEDIVSLVNNIVSSTQDTTEIYDGEQ